jgi:hypothetical protein
MKLLVDRVASYVLFIVPRDLVYGYDTRHLVTATFV